MNYLFIARYNGWYFSLNAEERVNAKAVALALFPYSSAQPAVGFVFSDAFHYAQPAPNPYDVSTLTPLDAVGLDKSNQAASAIQPASVVQSQVGATQPRDLGYGWVVIVSEANLTALMDAMGYPDGPFCRMFSIDIIPLNGDQTSLDIYVHMTPSHWQ